MYGLVNKGIRDLVIAVGGEAKWTEVCRLAQLDQEQFVPLKSYPDKLTYDLVAAVVQATGLPEETVLREFGKYFIKFTGSQGHSAVFDQYPKTKAGLSEFIGQLDDMHARIMLAMPDLVPPQIGCDEDDGGFTVHYRSQRLGLCPMVVGLLEGLLEYFAVSGTVHREHDEVSDGETYARFRVTFSS